MNSEPKEQNSRWNGRFSITLTLTTAIVLLVVISTGGVLGVGIWLAQKNTFDLLSKNANQSIANLVKQIEQHLIPARLQTEFVARQIQNGEINHADNETFGKLLTGTLAAAQQVESISYIEPNLLSLKASRDENSRVNLDTLDYSEDRQIREYWDTISDEPLWTAPIWRDASKKTYLNIAYPVKRGSSLAGIAVAVVSVPELSSFVKTVDISDQGKRFVLYGRDKVLAHPILAQEFPGRSVKQPLPELVNFPDRILASIWQEKDRHDLLFDLAQDTNGHVLEIDNQEFVFLFRRLHGFGPKPLLVGEYFRVSDVGTEIRRMAISLIVGLGTLLLALIIAVIMGRRIARPIVQFSTATSRIGKLDIANIQDLPGSVFRELNNQAISFNAMLRALRWFELYIPKKIVDRLIKRGEIGDAISAERTITVMFTDIVEFSSISEGMTAPQVATFVNRHFEIVTNCIEKEKGTVDKFIGDSVMAFWGAPDAQEDATERACRAALAIRDAVRKENIRLVSEGEKPVGIRIGVHTGNATVGNIGAPDRINYTIIGDTVNIGQRIEQLGKIVCPSKDVSILISGDTANSLGSEFKLTRFGSHKIKGRTGEIEVFGLS